METTTPDEAKRAAAAARRKLWGNNIRTGRLAQKLSQEEFGDLVKVTQQTVSYWETGTWAPRDDQKLEISKVLNQDVTWLFPLRATT